MDVKRIESVAIPTAIAGAGAGAAGFLAARAFKDGQMTDKFVRYVADGLENNDKKLIKTADKLDKINPFITDEEIIKLNGDRNKVLAFADKKLKAANAALEKFAKKHAKALGIVPEEGQSLSDAVKAFLKDKDAAAVKEIFLPESQRNLLENSGDYKKALKEEFAEDMLARSKTHTNKEVELLGCTSRGAPIVTLMASFPAVVERVNRWDEELALTRKFVDNLTEIEGITQIGVTPTEHDLVRFDTPILNEIAKKHPRKGFYLYEELKNKHIVGIKRGQTEWFKCSTYGMTESQRDYIANAFKEIVEKYKD